MRILKFDAVGGASGDMILGALLVLGANTEELNHILHTLCRETILSVRTDAICESGICGVRTHILAGDKEADAPHTHDHHHGHHSPHHHIHDGPVHQTHHVAHAHRTLADIRHLLHHAEIADPVKHLALQIFEKLAIAEGEVHGKPMDAVHFHEVGAWDSIADIVGISYAFHTLNIDAIWFDALPCGHGEIICQHGVMPNPAPATAILLKNELLSPVNEPFELVTPTAAAVLTALPRIAAPHAMRIEKSVYSFGHRTLQTRPNLLRATLCETADIATDLHSKHTDALILECDVDDMTPEIAGYAVEQLFKQGALDVTMIPAIMKKQRPGVRLSVLIHPSDRMIMVDTILAETTTFGVREYPVKRTILDREIRECDTPYGKIKVKFGSRAGKIVTVSPEYESCKTAAEKYSTPLKTVMAAALNAAQLASN